MLLLLQLPRPAVAPPPFSMHCERAYIYIKAFEFAGAGSKISQEVLDVFEQMAFPRGPARTGSVVFVQFEALKDETEYCVRFVAPGRVVLGLGDYALLFYALAVMSQLVTAVPGDESEFDSYALFECNLTQRVRFYRRVFMLDVSSHYFPDALLRRVLRGLALLSYNEAIFEFKPYFALENPLQPFGRLHANDFIALREVAAALGVQLTFCVELDLELSVENDVNLRFLRRALPVLKALGAYELYLDISRWMLATSFSRAQQVTVAAVLLTEKFGMNAFVVEDGQGAHEKLFGDSLTKLAVLSEMRVSYAQDYHLLYINVWNRFAQLAAQQFAGRSYYLVSLDCEDVTNEHLVQRVFLRQLPIMSLMYASDPQTTPRVTLDDVPYYEQLYCKLWAAGVVKRSLNPRNMCYGILY